MALSELDVLRFQAEALYTHDSSGRIERVNEPDGGPASLLFLGRTRLGNIWRLRYDIPAALADDLEQLLRDEPVVDDLRVPPIGMDRMRSLLMTYTPSLSSWDGPAYYFPDTLPVPADVVRVDRQTIELARPFFGSFDERAVDRLQARWPVMVRLVDGEPVAMCMSSRLTGQAAEAGVETLEAHRGRGHAVAVVTGWASTIRASGRIPLYSTSWDNIASQGVARRLGLVLYATNHSIG